jgi:hypothetical protein
VAKKKTSKRVQTRFLPDPGSYALLDSTHSEKGTAFTPDVTGLLANESFGGCSLVVIGSKQLKKGLICRIKLGYLVNPLLVEVRWRKELAEGISRVGLKYID